jgi:ketosteroid isomerase-like protein
MESLRVKVFGDAAYAFFILRQQYTVDGGQLDEYLPTTFVLERRGEKWKIIHAHRSTDYETIQQYVALQRQRAAKKK